MIEALSLVLALIGGLLPLLEKFLRRKLGREKEEGYSEKLRRLTDSLQKASIEVDDLLKELANVAKTRTAAVSDLETQLLHLTEREQVLKQRVEELQATPVPVAEHLAALISKGERRSALRDYSLFGLGVVVSTVMAIVLRLAGLG
jgi:hypothetical protein